MNAQPAIHTTTIADVERNTDYKDFILFGSDRDIPGLVVNLQWQVKHVAIDGGAGGHYRIRLVIHEGPKPNYMIYINNRQDLKKTFVSEDGATKESQIYGDYSGVAIMAGNANVSGYPLGDTIKRPDNEYPTIGEFVYLLLHPPPVDDATKRVESPYIQGGAENYHPGSPLLWYRYANDGGGPKGCRHWIETYARIVGRSGLLVPNNNPGGYAKVLADGEKPKEGVEKKKDENKYIGTFYTAKPTTWVDQKQNTRAVITIVEK